MNAIPEARSLRAPTLYRVRGIQGPVSSRRDLGIPQTTTRSCRRKPQVNLILGLMTNTISCLLVPATFSLERLFEDANLYSRCGFEIVSCLLVLHFCAYHSYFLGLPCFMTHDELCFFESSLPDRWLGSKYRPPDVASVMIVSWMPIVWQRRRLYGFN